MQQLSCLMRKNITCIINLRVKYLMADVERACNIYMKQIPVTKCNDKYKMQHENLNTTQHEKMMKSLYGIHHSVSCQASSIKCTSYLYFSYIQKAFKGNLYFVLAATLFLYTVHLTCQQVGFCYHQVDF